MSYQEAFNQSVVSKEAFWLDKSTSIDWYKLPTDILTTDHEGHVQWFADGQLNTSYLALDYHIANGRGNQLALIYDSPVTNSVQKFTYSQLKIEVAKFASVLHKKGVKKGDRVVIYMPMIPQTVITMLACARIGAVHSVVFGGFAAHELAVRIDDATPKVVVSASCGLECETVIPYKILLDNALAEASHQLEHCIIFQREPCRANLIEGRDHDWHTLMHDAVEMAPVIVDSTDPLYILYTSGTTGAPKGVVRDNGGHAVAMKYSMETIYGMSAGEVFWAASDVGWVVGHSYIVYGPLITGCTTILFEGKPVRTPDASAFWRVCQEHQVKALFSAPTAFRAICKEDPNGELFQQYQLNHLQRLYLAGERLDPATYHWLKETTQRPVIDHWWQTETGWAIAGNPVGIEVMETKAGAAGVPSPGYNVKVLDEKGKELANGEEGSIAIKLPLPPGCISTIWQDPQRFKTSYLKTYEGYYLSGDGGYFDHDGYLFIMGRTDDVINVAGHRLSTGEMEEIIAEHQHVAECAVVGVDDQIKGQLPCALVILKNGVQLTKEQIQQELKDRVRKRIGAIASLKDVLVVERLPKTRSGKILRKTIRQLLDKKDYTVPSTIDDVSVLDELANQLLEQVS